MAGILRRAIAVLATCLVGASAVAMTPTAEAAGGVARWNRTTVYVVNELGSAWPIGAAAEAWSSPSRLDLIVLDQCPIRTPSCITVTWGGLPSETLGETSTDQDGLGRYRAATVVINRQISPDYSDQLKLLLVRHELGHALGFNHTSKPDVMNEKITEDGCPLLGAYHVQTLREVYGS